MNQHPDTDQAPAEAQRATQGHTCSGCPTRWTGANRAHCSAEGCHRTFASTGLFDRHRRGGICLDPADISGMEFRDGLWRGPALTNEQRAKAEARWSV